MTVLSSADEEVWASIYVYVLAFMLFKCIAFVLIYFRATPPPRAGRQTMSKQLLVRF